MITTKVYPSVPEERLVSAAVAFGLQELSISEQTLSKNLNLRVVSSRSSTHRGLTNSTPTNLSVIVYAGSCSDLREIVHTLFHELAHVQQLSHAVDHSHHVKHTDHYEEEAEAVAYGLLWKFEAMYGRLRIHNSKTPEVKISSL
jgi:Zn-dependent peptidase ImmA (M78 family)